MTLDERRAAFPRGCQVRQVLRRDWEGRVVGWSRKYDAIYVVRAGSKSGVSLLGACHLWERCDAPDAPEAPDAPSIEEHW